LLPSPDDAPDLASAELFFFNTSDIKELNFATSDANADSPNALTRVL